MIRALWLTSWYPNRLDTMNGDFIQRHARAVAGFCKVDVIHVEPDKKNEITKTFERSATQTKNLSETIVLYKPFRGLGVLSKLLSLRRYYNAFKKEIGQYIQENGLPDIVHVHVPMKAGLLALWMKKKYKIVFVVTEHWTIYHDNAAYSYYNRNAAFKYFTKKIFTQANLFLPVSKNLGELICKKVAEVPYVVVPNVVDTTFFNADNLDKQNDDVVFRFIHVSTLHEQKNPGGIIRSFAKFYQQYSAAELWIVGGNPDELVSLSNQLGITKAIHFLGLLSYKEVAQKMKCCHVLVMFSRYENMPCVIEEALCCGLPVISTNVGGISEVIDELNGKLVRNEEEQELLKAMIDIFINYISYNRNEISARAISRFSYEHGGANIENIYATIINTTAEKLPV